MKRKLAIILCALIAGSSVLSLGGCGSAGSPDISENPAPAVGSTFGDIYGDPDNTDSHIEQTPDNPSGRERYDEICERVRPAINAFSAELFKREFSKNENGENTLISPLSVYTALAMVSNGADTQTKSEIIDILSGYFNYDTGVVCYADHEPLEADDMNMYFKGYMNMLNDGDVIDTKLSMANSFWAIQNDDVVFNTNFYSDCQNYYNAEIFEAALNSETVKKINGWVSEKTDGMIDGIVDDSITDTDLVAALLNAIAFDGKWLEPYDDISNREFSNYDGAKTETEFMSSVEDRYIDDGYATGFIKDYSGNGFIQYHDLGDGSSTEGGAVENEDPRYCFVALMPNEDVGIDEYISEHFTDRTISDAVENASYGDVYAKLPKFSFDCYYNLNESLQELGMVSAFDHDAADFSKLAVSERGNNISISDVLHSTHIEVDENGTKAAAVTAILMEEDSIEVATCYYVTLDRPFLFAIYDYDEQTPVFIGTVMTEND